MVSQSESEPGNWLEEIKERSTKREVPTDVVGLKPTPERLRRHDDIAGGDIMPVEPSTRDIEAGSYAARAFFEDATGKRFSEETMDKESQRILYDLNLQRESWSASMETDFEMQIQSIFPDNGGTAVHGPL